MGLLGDFRHALRTLRRAPGFTLVAVATLAIGIGANTAIFGLVDAVLLRPLPYPESDRLVMLWQDFTRRDGPATEWFSPGNFVDWRDQADSFGSVGAFTPWGPTLIHDGEPTPLAGGVVTPGFLTTLGVRPALGRLFSADEERPGTPNRVVVSHRVWRDRLGGAPDAIGRSIQLGGDSYEVVGVLEPGFEFPLLPGTDVFTPLTIDPASAPRGSIFLRVVGRLAPGASLERAQAETSGIAARLAAAYPEENTGVGAYVQPLHEALVGSVRLALMVLFAGVGAVLLIACVNLANLLLVRANRRRRDGAVRTALGASRARIARMHLAESGLLAVAGAGAGLFLAGSLMDVLEALSPMGLPSMFEPGLTPPVIGFAATLALVALFALGLAPAWSAAGGDVAEALRDGGRGGSARLRGRQLLVAAQIAFALVLLVAAGLLTRSFVRLQSVDPGFRAEGVLAFKLTTPTASYPEPEQVASFYRDLLERLVARDEVASAGAVSNVPFSGDDTDVDFVIEGRPVPGPGERNVIWYRQITPGYLETMEIPVVRGRGLRPEDATGAPVVVLGEAAAERFFPGQDPVGKRIKPGSDPENDRPWWTVVGVVGSVHHAGLAADPKLEMYLPHQQSPRRNMAVVLRSANGDAAALGPLVRAVVKEADPTLAVANLMPMKALIAGSMAVPRFLTLAIGTFASLALLLALIGVYGVISQIVGQRTRELGIRMALGADGRSVLRLVLGQGIAMIAVGAVAGLVVALGTSRVLRGLLFEVDPLDPLVLAAIPFLLAAAALLATYVPARRAARVDPTTALRTE